MRKTMAQGPSYPKAKFKVKFVSREESVMSWVNCQA